MLIVASEGQGIWCEHFLRHLAKIANKDIHFEKSNRSNLIIRSMFFPQEQEFPVKLPYICWSGESVAVPERTYPPLFTIWSPNPIANCFQIPFFNVVFFDYGATFNIKYNLKDLSLYPNNPRPYFLAYCASNPIYERETLFKLVKERDRTNTCHGLGRCQTTSGFRDTTTFNNLRNVYSAYRFAFAMENKVIPSYVTEKLLNVMLAGAIPIYYGDSTWVKKVFNEQAIIFVQDFPTLEECADYIVYVDSNPKLLKQYQSQKHFIKDEFLGYFSDDISLAPKEYKEMALKLNSI